MYGVNHVCYEPCVCLIPKGAREASLPGTGVVVGCEPSCRCWELHLGSLEKWCSVPYSWFCFFLHYCFIPSYCTCEKNNFAQDKIVL